MDVFFSQLKYEKVTQLKAYELPNYLSMYDIQIIQIIGIWIWIFECPQLQMYVNV